jgi:hypothetical protein
MGFNIFIKTIGQHFQISMKILDFFNTLYYLRKTFLPLRRAIFQFFDSRKNVQNGIFKISFSYLFPNSKTQLDMKLFF